jgi:copper chaperone CopZ
MPRASPRWKMREIMSAKPVTERLKLRIIGLDCVACSRVIDRALQDMKGVRKVGVSYLLDLVLVDYEPSMLTKEEIMSIVKKTGYDVIPVAI